MLVKLRSILAARQRNEVSRDRPEDPIIFTSWDDARACSDGYDKDVILQRALAAAIKVKEGEAAFERDTVLFDKPAYRWQMLACIASVAASKQGNLHVLDIGGSVASVYFQHRLFLDLVPNLCWSIVEQPHIVAKARDTLEEDRLRFFDSIQEVTRFRPADLTIMSSSLQYMRDPYATLRDVAETHSSHLIIDRIPLSHALVDTIVVQRVPEEIYPASYPEWRLSEAKVVDFLSGLRYQELARYNDGIDSSDHVGLFFART